MKSCINTLLTARLRRLFAALSCTTLIALPALPNAQAAETLPPAVAQSLKAAGIDTRNIGVFIQGVDASQPLLRHNAQRALNPASAMKLVTTYAALELLGPAYTWKT